MASADGRNRTPRDLVPGFAQMIQIRREELGLSRQQLANETGIGMTSICCIEKEWRAPSLRVAAVLAKALGLDFPLSEPVPRKYLRAEPPGPGRPGRRPAARRPKLKA